jgi:hypothetical protein
VTDPASAHRHDDDVVTRIRDVSKPCSRPKGHTLLGVVCYLRVWDEYVDSMIKVKCNRVQYTSRKRNSSCVETTSVLNTKYSQAIPVVLPFQTGRV